MAGALKGITIEIGGDTTKLGKALNDIKGKTGSLQSELRGINTLLKFNPNNTVLLSQKQQLLTASVKQTKEELELLKQTQDKIDGGELEATEAQYRDLQREILTTENRLKSLVA